MSRQITARTRTAGFTLVELMIGLLLGTLVVGAAYGIFLSNQKTYRTTEALARTQESLRTAFELMARDLRMAGGNACNQRPANFRNALTGGSGQWWGSLTSAGWSSAIQGLDGSTAFPNGGVAFGSATGQRLSGSDALQTFSAGDIAISISADGGSAFTVNTGDHGFVAGDVLLACDTNNSAIFSAGSIAGTQISHPTSITFGANATLSRLNAARWYVGNNSEEGTSLFRSRLYAGSERQEEIADNVSAMRLEYLASGASSYVQASAISDWSAVTAIRISLTLTRPERVSDDGKALERELIHVVQLRNRNG